MKEWMKRFLRPAVYVAVFAALLGGSAFLTYRVMITRMTVEVPDLTGMELAREILRSRPKTPVILCTGYSAMVSEDEYSQTRYRQISDEAT